ncbi:MAG: phosphoglucosamine mutase, partial [Candidatus Anammoxibacter sp.]
MGKLFGTDGIRGKVNTYPMTGDIAFKLGQATSLQFCGKNKTRVLIGKDTRQSCSIFEHAITAGFVSMGADVYLAGTVPTPTIAYLVRSLNMDVGIVISASHNLAEDNGIKFFDGLGYKLSDDVECDIEKRVLSPDDFTTENIKIEDIGKVYTINDAAERYIKFAKESIKNSSLKGIKIVLDCA